MKKFTTEQKNRLRKARKLLSNAIQGNNFEHDDLTGKTKSLNSLLVDAENLISEVNEELYDLR